MSIILRLLGNRQFLCIACVQMLTVFSTSLLSPVLPVHFKVQGMSEAEIGFIMGIVSLGAMLVRPWTGWCVDRKGSRLTVLTGQLMAAAGIAGFIWITGFWPFLLLRFFQGIAMAFFGTGGITFASGVETPANTPAAIGYFSLFTMIGLGFGTSLAAFLYHAFHFEAVIAVSLTTAVTATAVMWLFSRPQPVLESEKRTPFRTVLVRPEVSAPSVCLFASNFALGTAFTFVPLLAFYLQIEHYVVFFVAFSLSVVCARVSLPYLHARSRPEYTAVYASCLNIGSALCIAAVPSLYSLVAAGIMIGFGFGVIYPTMAGYLVQRVQPESKGTALSILAGSGDIGNALGASVLGMVAQGFGFTAVFLGSAAVSALSVYYFYRVIILNGRGEKLESL